jgi:hypothetical protein
MCSGVAPRKRGEIRSRNERRFCVAALCDALQQRRTACALGGLSPSRDAAISLRRPGKAEAAPGDNNRALASRHAAAQRVAFGSLVF